MLAAAMMLLSSLVSYSPVSSLLASMMSGPSIPAMANGARLAFWAAASLAWPWGLTLSSVDGMRMLL
jgi:hypothetical protein